MDPMILELIIKLVTEYPNITTALLVIGILRVINKPLFSLLRIIVQSTKTTKDDEMLDKVEGSLAYKIFCFALDWFASFKLPLKK